MRGFHLKKFHKTALILFAAIIITVGISGTIAKYITTDTRKGSVTFTATLAERVELVENAVERQIDGSYAIMEGEVQGNSYLAMPGVDIVKNPRIEINGKTTIDAYLFIEVADNCPGTITYDLTENWLEVTGAAPKHTQTGYTSKVYVYTTDGTNASVLNESFGTDGTGSIQILKDNKVIVSEQMTSVADVSIALYGTMVQVLEDDTLAEAYAR